MWATAAAPTNKKRTQTQNISSRKLWERQRKKCDSLFDCLFHVTTSILFEKNLCLVWTRQFCMCGFFTQRIARAPHQTAKLNSKFDVTWCERSTAAATAAVVTVTTSASTSIARCCRMVAGAYVVDRCVPTHLNVDISKLKMPYAWIRCMFRRAKKKPTKRKRKKGDSYSYSITYIMHHSGSDEPHAHTHWTQKSHERQERTEYNYSDTFIWLFVGLLDSVYVCMLVCFTQKTRWRREKNGRNNKTTNDRKPINLRCFDWFNVVIVYIDRPIRQYKVQWDEFHHTHFELILTTISMDCVSI